MDEGRTKHVEAGRASSLMFMTGIRRETTILKKALLISLIFHTFLFWIVFPTAAGDVNKIKGDDTIVTQFVPPPPKKEQPKIRRVLITAQAAIIPDPTPDAPEPASEYVWEDEDNTMGPLGEADWIYDAGDRGPILADGVKVKLPECYHRIIPLYPELARKARIKGAVVIQAIWDTNGRITGAKVVSSPGKQFGFDDAALTAIKDWKCYPATLGGRKVEVYGTVIVNFTMP